MDVTVYEGTIKRDLDDSTLFNDLFTTPVYTGYSMDEIGYVLHFDGNLTDAQVFSVRERVYYTAEEETERKRARQAIADNNAWRTNTYPQVLSGANAIINSTAAGVSATDKDLARAVRTLANKMDDVLAQNNALIRLVVEL